MPAGFTPIYKIMKDGEDITSNFNSRTLSIKVQLKGGGGNSDTCEITLDDRDWKVAAVEAGVKIEIYLGYKETGCAQMGAFEVTTVDYEINPRQIRIVGTGTSFTGKLKEVKIQSFENKTLGEIVQELARQGGIEAFVSPEIAKHRIPYINQITSPLHLIHEIERRYGALAKSEDNKLTIVPRDAGQTVSGLGTMVLVLTPPNVTKGFVRHTTRGDYGSAKVGWYDADHRKQYVEEVAPGAPRDENGELEDPVFLSGKLARSENEAREMAKAHLAAVRRTTGELHVTLSKGDPWIRDQMRTLVKGFRDKVNGSYVNDTVTHTYVKDAGIQTEIFGKPPGDGADYSSLDEGNFYALGSGGVVGPAGPQLPDGSKVGVDPAPAPEKNLDLPPPPPPPPPPPVPAVNT